MFLQIRTIILLGIIYLFLNISTDGKITFQLPNLKNASNIIGNLQNAKDQVANLIGTTGNIGTSNTTPNKSNTNSVSNGNNGNFQMAKKLQEALNPNKDKQ
jgi:hypothetical protein